MGKKFGFSFSWKRALGISAAKGRLSRKIGIPLTRSGRERKFGRWLLGGSKAGKTTVTDSGGDGGGIGCLGTLIVVALVGYGASRLFNHSTAPTPTKDALAAVSEMPAVPKSPANVPAPDPVAVAEAQRLAVKRYPALGIANSSFNREFTARYKRYQTEHAEYFNDSSWPTKLADEIASEPQTPTAPRAVPAGAAAVAAQQRAIAKFPQLGVKDSRLNRAFIETVRRYQTDKPEVFEDADWPTIIVTEAAESIK
ncbi:MAG: hypothetical protein ABI318_11790 [Chthoniobacteraceae bacterium]